MASPAHIATVFTFLLSGLSSQAQDYKIVDRPDSSVIVRNTSEFHRLNKKVNVFIGAHAYSNVSGYELGFEYYLDRNKVLQIEFLSGRATWTDTINEIFGDQSKTEATGALVSYKYYTGNSFFLRGGIDYVQHDYYRLDRDLFDTTINGEQSFTADSAGVLISIGNQWQIENLTLGFDWIGLRIPAYTKIKNIRNSYSQSDYQTRYFEDDQNTFVKRTSGFASARVGISF